MLARDPAHFSSYERRVPHFAQTARGPNDGTLVSAG
jgi:hypothetical protein